MVTTSSGDNDPTVYNNVIQFSLSSDSPFVSFIPLLQSRIDLALHCNQRLFVVELDIDLYIRHFQWWLTCFRIRWIFIFCIVTQWPISSHDMNDSHLDQSFLEYLPFLFTFLIPILGMPQLIVRIIFESNATDWTPFSMLLCYSFLCNAFELKLMSFA